MQPFSKLTAVAAPIDLANIDTDRIIPARFLRKPKGAPGYASFLFRDVRFDADGSEKPEFVLNRMPYRGAKILVVPVILPADIVAAFRRQLRERPGATITVDLDSQTVTAPNGTPHRFDVDPFRKDMLLTGRDETGLTLGFESRIREFEERHAREMSWVVPAGR